MAKALIIVDVQNDFVEGGSLAVNGGKAVGEEIIKIIRNSNEYDLIVTTQDWHIDPKGHFAETPDFVDTWPVHCVANTEGAQIIDNLQAYLNSQVVAPVATFHKGEYEAAYSGFEAHNAQGIELADFLRANNIHEIDVTGIATDYCVKATAVDGAANGFATTVLQNAVAGIHAENTTELLTTGFPNNNVQVR